MSEEEYTNWKKKISDNKKGKVTWNKGLTKETDSRLKRLSKKCMGRKFSEEAKRKSSLVHKGQIPWNKGKSNVYTLETKKRMSRIKMGEINSAKRPEVREKIKEKRKVQVQIYTSSIELKIQKFLSLLHIEYLTHKYISEITHAYQCDLFIPSIKTIIECDGCYWHGCPICKKKINSEIEEQIERDKTRTKELQERGFKVIRLWEHEIRQMRIKNFKEFIFKKEAQ